MRQVEGKFLVRTQNPLAIKHLALTPFLSIESIDSIEVANMYRFSFTRQARLGPLADRAKPRHAEGSSMHFDEDGIVIEIARTPCT